MTNYAPKQRGALQRLLTPERAAKLAAARARRRERLRSKQNAKQELKQQRKQLVGAPHPVHACFLPCSGDTPRCACGCCTATPLPAAALFCPVLRGCRDGDIAVMGEYAVAH